MTFDEKFKLGKEEVNGLHRVIALRDFSDVKKGEQGGFIEKEANLSHEGNAWVYGDALVYGNDEMTDFWKGFICGIVVLIVLKLIGVNELQGLFIMCGISTTVGLLIWVLWILKEVKEQLKERERK